MVRVAVGEFEAAVISKWWCNTTRYALSYAE
jgi:hypothetical protein